MRTTEVSATNIREFGLSVRAVNCLTSEGIATVGDLCNSSQSKLMKIPGLGRKTFFEILMALDWIGLTVPELTAEESAYWSRFRSSTALTLVFP